MNLTEKVSEIDALILGQLPTDCNAQRWRTKKHGLCRLQFNQSHDRLEKGKLIQGGWLLHETNGTKVTIDDSFDVQLIHVNTSGTATQKEPWGSTTDMTFNYDMKLIVLTKKNTVLDRILAALEKSGETEFYSFRTETEPILTSELKLNIGTGKNYPPDLKAYLFNYKVYDINPIIEDEL